LASKGGVHSYEREMWKPSRADLPGALRDARGGRSAPEAGPKYLAMWKGKEKENKNYFPSNTRLRVFGKVNLQKKKGGVRVERSPDCTREGAKT